MCKRYNLFHANWAFWHTTIHYGDALIYLCSNWTWKTDTQPWLSGAYQPWCQILPRQQPLGTLTLTAVRALWQRASKAGFKRPRTRRYTATGSVARCSVLCIFLPSLAFFLHWWNEKAFLGIPKGHGRSSVFWDKWGGMLLPSKRQQASWSDL